jgi:CRP-like cAMP-binding protein
MALSHSGKHSAVVNTRSRKGDSMKKRHLESPLFSALSEEERRTISSEMQPEDYHKGETIFAEGTPGQAMYVVESGWVSIMSETDGRKSILANLGPGSVLGEMAFFGDRPYSTSAEAASEVTVWTLTKSAFAELIASEPSIGVKLSLASGSKIARVSDYLAESRLPSVPFFSQLSIESLLALAERLEVQSCQRGDTICWLGESGEAMYIVESGEIEVVLGAESDEVPIPLAEGDLVGEMALLANKPYSATYRASREVVLWRLGRSDFDELIQDFPVIRQALSRALSEHLGPEDRAAAEERLETIPLFADIPPDVLRRVAQRLVLQHYPQGESVFSHGDPGDSMYVIEVGEIKLSAETPTGDSTVAWLESGDSFGEMALLTGKTRSVKAQAMTDTNLWVLYKNDYDELMVEHPAISVALGKVLTERLTSGFQEERPRVTPTRIRELPLLAELTEAELEDVARRLQPEEWATGDVLFKQGDPGDRMYFTESGQVELRTVTPEGLVRVTELGPGELVGETALLTGKPRVGTARAASALQLWVLQKDDFDDLTHKYPRFVLAIGRALGDRLEATSAVPEPTREPAQVLRPKPMATPRRGVVRQRPQASILAGLADTVTGFVVWLVGRGTGAKIRLAVVGFLVIWLCGITLPATVISSVPLEKDDLMAAFASATPTETPAASEAPQEAVETPEPTNTPTVPVEDAMPAAPEAGGAEAAVILAVMPTETPTPEPPTPTFTSVPATPDRTAPTATATTAPAPNVMGAARAAPPSVTVTDMNGVPRDLDWARTKYGSWVEFTQPQGGASYRVAELRERSGPSNIDVWVLDEAGNPIPQTLVRVKWPGGDDVKPTGLDGKRDPGFALGPGCYILDPKYGGAITISIEGQYPSDEARNLGMLAGTPHDHLDIVFKLVRTRG